MCRDNSKVDDMLSGKKLKQICQKRKMSDSQLAEHLVRGGMSKAEAASAIRNWMRGLYTPKPSAEDVEDLATALGVETRKFPSGEPLSICSYVSPQGCDWLQHLIAGRDVQDALDMLKFTHQRAADHIKKVLQNAIANADEQEADVDVLCVTRLVSIRQVVVWEQKPGGPRIAVGLIRSGRKPAIFM